MKDKNYIKNAKNIVELFEYYKKIKNEGSIGDETRVGLYDVWESLGEGTSELKDFLLDIQMLNQNVVDVGDALRRESKQEMTLDRFLSMAENDELDNLFLNAKESSLKVTLCDPLILDYSLTTRKQGVRQKYDEGKDEAVLSEKLVNEDDANETLLKVRQIRKIIEKEDFNFFRLIYDPFSYTKFFNNAFYVITALREKEVFLVLKNNEVFVTKETQNSELETSSITFTYELYENIKEKYGSAEPLIK